MRTTHIDARLDVYGTPVCPIDGNRLEHVFTRAGEIRQLVCRNHPGHPLYGVPMSEPYYFENHDRH